MLLMSAVCVDAPYLQTCMLLCLVDEHCLSTMKFDIHFPVYRSNVRLLTNLTVCISTFTRLEHLVLSEDKKSLTNCCWLHPVVVG